MGDVDEKSLAEMREDGCTKEEVVEAVKGLMVEWKEEEEEKRGAAARKQEVITRGIDRSGAAILAGSVWANDVNLLAGTGRLSGIIQ